MTHVFMLLLIMAPLSLLFASTDTCIEMSECKELSWITEVKEDVNFEKLKAKWFHCSNQTQNFVKCPSVTDEGMSKEEIKKHRIQVYQYGSDHGQVLTFYSGF